MGNDLDIVSHMDRILGREHLEAENVSQAPAYLKPKKFDNARYV